ncbi:MAG: OsmC family protein [Flavobacteriales bacterium]|nr:OsmC family protein [Flavobacteriales bacterium]
MKVELQRKNNKFHMEATNEQNVSIQIDGAPDIGGEDLGVRPMQLLLMGLGGCSSIDISMILGKQKLVIDDLKLVIEATRKKDSIPSIFEHIHMKVYLEGDLPESKAKRAVDLSITKYCSVAKILESTAKVTYSTYLNNKEI